jgi:hypothetical protein
MKSFEEINVTTTPPIFEPIKKFPSENTLSFFPEEKIRDVNKINDFLNILANLSDVFSSLGIDFNKEMAEKFFELAKNPQQENLRIMEEILKKAPVNFDIRAKMIKLATMSIMEYCHTYGCIPEAKKFVEKWEKESYAKRISSDKLPKDMEKIEKLVKEKEHKLRDDMYLTRFFYLVKKAYKEIENNNVKQFLSIMHEIGKEKDLDKIAASIVLNKKINEELEKIEMEEMKMEKNYQVKMDASTFKNFKKISNILKNLEQNNIGYNISFFTHVKKQDKTMEKKNEEKTEICYERLIESNDYEIFIKKENDDEKLEKINFEINKSLESLFIKVLDDVLETNKDNEKLYMKIEKRKETSVKVVGFNFIETLNEGSKTFIGPFNVVLINNVGKIIYKVKSNVKVEIEVINIGE